MSEEQTKWLTPTGTLSFPYLFKMNDYGEKPKYEATLLLTKEDDIKVLKAAAVAAAKEKWGKGPKEIKNFQSPFKDGTEKMENAENPEKYEAYRDKVVITAKTEFNVPVVNNKREEIIDEEDIYAGCKARFSVNVYTWEFKNKKGVGFGLQAVQKMGEGERFGGGRIDASVFDDGTEIEESVGESSDAFDDMDI